MAQGTMGRGEAAVGTTAPPGTTPGGAAGGTAGTNVSGGKKGPGGKTGKTGKKRRTGRVGSAALVVHLNSGVVRLPALSPDELTVRGEKLAGLVQGLSGGVPAGAPPMGAPGDAFLKGERSLSMVNTRVLGRGNGQAICQALGVDLGAYQQDLSVWGAAFTGYRYTQAIQQSCADGRRVAEKGRMLMRALVLAVAESMVQEGTLPEQERRVVERLLEEARVLLEQDAAVQQASREAMQKLQAHFAGPLGDVQRHQRLAMTFRALARSETPNWQDLVEAARYYDEVVGPPDGGQVTQTPEPLETAPVAAADRRGQGR